MKSLKLNLTYFLFILLLSSCSVSLPIIDNDLSDDEIKSINTFKSNDLKLIKLSKLDSVNKQVAENEIEFYWYLWLKLNRYTLELQNCILENNDKEEIFIYGDYFLGDAGAAFSIAGAFIDESPDKTYTKGIGAISLTWKAISLFGKDIAIKPKIKKATDRFTESLKFNDEIIKNKISFNSVMTEQDKDKSVAAFIKWNQKFNELKLKISKYLEIILPSIK